MKLTTDELKYQKQEATNLYNMLECINCKNKITYEELLNKYGPEGLYKIAEKLIKTANEDVKTVIKQSKQLCQCSDKATKHFIKNWCDDCKKYIL